MGTSARKTPPPIINVEMFPKLVFYDLKVQKTNSALLIQARRNRGDGAGGAAAPPRFLLSCIFHELKKIVLK